MEPFSRITTIIYLILLVLLRKWLYTIYFHLSCLTISGLISLISQKPQQADKHRSWWPFKSFSLLATFMRIWSFTGSSSSSSSSTSSSSSSRSCTHHRPIISSHSHHQQISSSSSCRNNDWKSVHFTTPWNTTNKTTTFFETGKTWMGRTATFFLLGESPVDKTGKKENKGWGFTKWR